MGARSWSLSAPTVPSSHHHHQHQSSSSTAAAAAGRPLFSSSSSSLSSSPSSSPPSSSSPSPTGGKKHRHHYNHLQQQQPKLPTRIERHAFFRIPVTGEGTKKPLDLTPQSVATAKAAVAAAAQKAERNWSVKRDLALDLPTCPTLPDGEEKPYGSSTRLRIRDNDQESEIYRECIRPPPNRTVHETSTSFPPFRCNSESILTGHSPSDGRVGNSKTAGPSSSSTNSSSSSSMAVYCCTSASYSSLSSTSSYRSQPQPPPQQQEGDGDGKDSFSSTPPCCTRLLLDIHGQPIVTRSKSMSTGSSLQPDACSSSSSGNLLAVMVPLPPQQSSTATTKTLESAMKCCVRSFRDRVNCKSAVAPCCVVSPPGGAVGGVDNAGFVESSATLPEQPNNNLLLTTHEPSSCSSRSKLANLPVVPCASAVSSQTRR